MFLGRIVRGIRRRVEAIEMVVRDCERFRRGYLEGQEKKGGRRGRRGRRANF